jgi:hypothetical protein
MVYFLTVVLMLEFRLAARLVGPFSSAWWWTLGPLWFRFAMTVVTLAPQRGWSA